ncbi:hypothetical protein G9C98_008285 [Cotesia typhae]|uniref:Uncharacterized protein n=1 Tax=Cotesia typhae TaxID=2053667 RepID=A0A8J5R837_9HYME|nr:hypothetical protein G9C98_008285 [Cotesia typhae]
MMMNCPGTRDHQLVSRSPGCCYHTWNPHQHVFPLCRRCLRPLLTLHHSALLSTCLHASHLTLCHDHHAHHLHHLHYHHQHRSRSAETTPTPLNRFDWRSSSSSSANPSASFRYHTHPLNSSKFSLHQPSTSHFSADSTPLDSSHNDSNLNTHFHDSNLNSNNNKNNNIKDNNVQKSGRISQRSSFKLNKPPGVDFTRWIGEETKRSLPIHVYKYYLAFIKEYHRQHFKLLLNEKFNESSQSLDGILF